MNRAERRRLARQQRKSGPDSHALEHERLYAEANEHLKGGRLGEAERCYGQLLDAYPGNADILNMLGIIAGRKNDHDTACLLVRKAIQANPGQSSYYSNLGLALRGANKLEDAVAAFRRAIELEPTLAQAHSNLGNTLKRLGKMDAAIKAFQKAIELVPDYSDAYHNLGLAFLNKGLLDKARSCYEQALMTGMKTGYFTSQSASQDRPFDRQLAREALLELKKILDKSDVEFFLRSGTLLGCIREADFLEHDKDIDIGVFESIEKDTLLRLITGSPGFNRVTAYDSKHNKASLSVSYKNTIVFDVYVYRDTGDHFIAESYMPGKSMTKIFSRFTLKPVEFVGATFLVPENYDLYLTELYGDWRVVDPYFDSMISSRNLEAGTEDLSRCFAYSRLGDALQYANHQRASAYCEQLLERFPADKVTLQVRNWLRDQ